MNAPRLANMTDWYLVHQLKNFQAGIRGGHPQDYYGKQMGFMARTLQDEQAINNVIAYINSLGPSPDMAARNTAGNTPGNTPGNTQ
jgi:cytochrome c oxidase subunit 2